MDRLKALGRIMPRVVVAVAAGALLGFAFEPHDHPWLTIVAVPLLLAALNGISMKAGFLVGAGFGIAYYAVLVPWLSIIGGDAAIALAILEGLFYAVFGLFATQVLKLRLWALWIPCLWVATEFATASVPFGGFPWGRLAWAFSDDSSGQAGRVCRHPGPELRRGIRRRPAVRRTAPGDRAPPAGRGARRGTGDRVRECA